MCSYAKRKISWTIPFFELLCITYEDSLKYAISKAAVQKTPKSIEVRIAISRAILCALRSTDNLKTTQSSCAGKSGYADFCNMSPVESDDETPAPTSMDVDKSETTADLNDTDEKKKKAVPKPPVIPFFTMNPDGNSMTTYLPSFSTIKHMATVTLEEMAEAEAHYAGKDVPVPDGEPYAEVIKMYARGKTNEEIEKFASEHKLDISDAKFYTPKIPFDPDIDVSILQKLSAGDIKIHESLENAIKNAKGEEMESIPYCCNMIHEIGAKKMAQKTGRPIACLAYGASTKVSTNNIDSVFNIDRPKPEKPEDSEKAKKADKLNGESAGAKKKTIDDYVNELETSRKQSGYNVKVAMYNEAMAMSTDGPPEGMDLEEMIIDAWRHDHDRDAKERQKQIDDLSGKTDQKSIDKRDLLKKKSEEKKAKLEEHVKAEAEKIRVDVEDKYCVLKESKIKKAASLKLARNKEFKKETDKYNVELNKLMEQERKKQKEKLVPKSDKGQLEGIAKKQYYTNLRRKRLKKSQIVCPVTLTSYTPLTNVCPIGNHVNITEAQKKAIDKSKVTVMNKYAAHVGKVIKKGFRVKIFI